MVLTVMDGEAAALAATKAGNYILGCMHVQKKLYINLILEYLNENYLLIQVSEFGCKFINEECF